MQESHSKLSSHPSNIFLSLNVKMSLHAIEQAINSLVELRLEERIETVVAKAVEQAVEQAVKPKLDRMTIDVIETQSFQDERLRRDLLPLKREISNAASNVRAVKRSVSGPDGENYKLMEENLKKFIHFSLLPLKADCERAHDKARQVYVACRFFEAELKALRVYQPMFEAAMKRFTGAPSAQAPASAQAPTLAQASLEVQAQPSEEDEPPKKLVIVEDEVGQKKMHVPIVSASYNLRRKRAKPPQAAANVEEEPILTSWQIAARKIAPLLKM